MPDCLLTVQLAESRSALESKLETEASDAQRGEFRMKVTDSGDLDLVKRKTKGTAAQVWPADCHQDWIPPLLSDEVAALLGQDWQMLGS